MYRVHAGELAVCSSQYWGSILSTFLLLFDLDDDFSLARDSALVEGLVLAEVILIVDSPVSFDLTLLSLLILRTGDLNVDGTRFDPFGLWDSAAVFPCCRVVRCNVVVRLHNRIEKCDWQHIW